MPPIMSGRGARLVAVDVSASGRCGQDHSSLLNRAEGSRGLRWHSHSHTGDDDGLGPPPRYTGLQLVRTLIYPQGWEGEDAGAGGQLSLVPGAHLLREVAAWRQDNNRPHYDVFDANELAESAWFRAQRHPLTGEPLRVERLALPPGSLVSFIHHMPHDVGAPALP